MAETLTYSKEKIDVSNEILFPKKEELLPCGINSTFSECGFTNGEFGEQTIETQLSVAKEIIRQAIEIDYFPNENSESKFAGDCSTAAKYLMEYMKKLGIPGETCLVSVRRNPFNGEQRISTRHVVVLHKNNGVYRTIDPTPMVGYGYGSVGCECSYENGRLTSLDEQEVVYQDVERLTDNDVEIIEKINTLRHEYFTNGSVNLSEAEKLAEEAVEKVGGNYMNSWLSEIHYVIAMTHLSRHEIPEYQSSSAKAVELDPLKPKILENSDTDQKTREKIESAMEQYRREVEIIIEQWGEIVRDIWIRKDAARYREAFLKKQWIFREQKSVGLIIDPIPSFLIHGKSVPAYNLNPRLVSEYGLTAAWIKPVSGRMGVWAAAHEVLRAVGKIEAEYQCNAGIPGRDGELPIIFSHPHAIRPDNLRAYTGPMTVMLLDAKPTELNKVKKQFRSDWGNVMNIKEGLGIHWFNGTDVEWNRFVTNYIHSTDNAPESVVHFLLAYPHLSLVSRWGYPHPKL